LDRAKTAAGAKNRFNIVTAKEAIEIGGALVRAAGKVTFLLVNAGADLNFEALSSERSDAGLERTRLHRTGWRDDADQRPRLQAARLMHSQMSSPHRVLAGERPRRRQAVNNFLKRFS